MLGFYAYLYDIICIDFKVLLLSQTPQAKNNLVGHTTKEARDLELSCSLNLMSCYLKTRQFSDVISVGSEVRHSIPLYWIN